MTGGMCNRSSECHRRNGPAEWQWHMPRKHAGRCHNLSSIGCTSISALRHPRHYHSDPNGSGHLHMLEPVSLASSTRSGRHFGRSKWHRPLNRLSRCLHGSYCP